MERRKFISNLGLVTGAALIGQPAINLSMPESLSNYLKNETDDEALWKTIRQQFVYPEGYSYLNTSGIGTVPLLVLKDVDEESYQDQIEPAAGHDEEKWLDVKRKCTSVLGRNIKPEEIALTSTATEGINIVLSGLPLQRGDEIITSTHEHPAVHIPLLNLMQKVGIKIRLFEPDLKNGLRNVENIENLINDKTKLIFISHTTCTTGQCLPVKEIGELARIKGIWFALDGAQIVGTIPNLLDDVKVDFYAWSGHKYTLGPKRTGVLYVREEMLNTLRPTFVGAYSDDGYDIKKMELKFNPTAERYEYATQNEALFYGLRTAIDFINAIGIQKIQNYDSSLAEKFYSALQNIDGVTLLSPDEKEYRNQIISFKLNNVAYRDIAHHLSKNKIRVRVVDEAGLDCIRVSFHIHNNQEDLDKIIHEIKFLSKQ